MKINKKIYLKFEANYKNNINTWRNREIPAIFYFTWFYVEIPKLNKALFPLKNCWRLSATLEVALLLKVGMFLPRKFSRLKLYEKTVKMRDICIENDFRVL